VEEASITGAGGASSSDEAVGEAVRHYMEGRLEPAVRILERAAQESPFDPLAGRMPARILDTLESMARLDPQFRRERSGLRRRLLVLTGLVERRGATSSDGGEPRRV
jgi:hypothetical protein